MRNPRGHPILARCMDLAMRPLAPIRDRVVPDAAGRVLEIGVGTGLNLDRYRTDRVSDYVGIEPDPHMRARAIPRAAALPFPARIVDASAEALPFDPGTFDEVVLTFTLCTVDDPAAALAEIHRVLIAGGRVRFAEHTASDHAAMAWLQRLVDPVWTRLSGGCHLDRDPVALIADSGFVIEAIDGHGRRPHNLAPIHRGVARRR